MVPELRVRLGAYTSHLPTGGGTELAMRKARLGGNWFSFLGGPPAPKCTASSLLLFCMGAPRLGVQTLLPVESQRVV